MNLTELKARINKLALTRGEFKSAITMSPSELIPVGVDRVLCWIVPRLREVSDGGIIHASDQMKSEFVIPLCVSCEKRLDDRGVVFNEWLESIRTDIMWNQVPTPGVIIGNSGLQRMYGSQWFVIVDAERILGLAPTCNIEEIIEACEKEVGINVTES